MFRFYPITIPQTGAENQTKGVAVTYPVALAQGKCYDSPIDFSFCSLGIVTHKERL